jgi:methylmalonyl-CoA decarboxylase subunit alpha
MVSELKPMDDKTRELVEKTETIKKGGAPKYHEKLKEEKKLFVRDRLRLLLDPGFELEDALFANNVERDLPADGVVTGIGQIEGRTVCFMANDSTVKAGSWGWRTVEKILRIQETAEKLRVPMLYLVDSAGARITDQIEMFPGRRGAGRIFYNQVKLSGYIPQVCLLFGPSAAGGAYIPAFCDIVIMTEGRASMYLGSPRMAEMVIGEKVTLEEMGGARMHCSVSGCGDVLVQSEEEAIGLCKDYLRFMPPNCDGQSPSIPAIDPAAFEKTIDEVVPKQENVPFDMMQVINRLVDKDSFFEIKKLFAGEIITGLARIGGRPIGILANQPKVKGGVLFVDSADKSARFMWLCNAFSIPLLFLVDVPGFMIGTKVERAGIIRPEQKWYRRFPRLMCRKFRSSCVKHMAPDSTQCAVLHSSRMRAWLFLPR